MVKQSYIYMIHNRLPIHHRLHIYTPLPKFHLPKRINYLIPITICSKFTISHTFLLNKTILFTFPHG